MFSEDLAIFALASEPRRDLDLAYLKGKRVGITLGYTYPTNFMAGPQIARFEAKSDAQLLDILARDRVDYILMNGMPGYLKIREKALTVQVVKVGKPSTDGFWVAFSTRGRDGQTVLEGAAEDQNERHLRYANAASLKPGSDRSERRSDHIQTSIDATLAQSDYSSAVELLGSRPYDTTA